MVMVHPSEVAWSCTSPLSAANEIKPDFRQPIVTLSLSLPVSLTHPLPPPPPSSPEMCVLSFVAAAFVESKAHSSR